MGKKRFLVGLLVLLLSTVLLGRSRPSWERSVPAAVAAPRQVTPVPEQAGLAVFTGSALDVVSAVAFDPTDPTTIYAGAYNGLFKSIDGGLSWYLLSTELRYPRAILIDPSNPQVLYACRFALAEDEGTALPGIFKSTDGGISWQVLGEGTAGREIFSLTLDQKAPRVLYAGSWDGLVFKSSDAGETWSASGDKPLALEGIPSRAIIDLQVHPRSGEVYAVAETMGLFKSSDGGRTWAAIHQGSGYLAIDATSGTLYLAGRSLWKSSDGGQSWQDVSGNLPLHQKTSSHLLTWVGLNPDPLVLYVQWFYLQTYRSLDGGATWTLLDAGVRFLPRGVKAGRYPVLYGSAGATLGRYVDLDVP